MTVWEALKHTEARFAAAGLENAEAEAHSLLESLLGLSRTHLLLKRSTVLTEQELVQLEAWCLRREAREPLQHILGVAPFYGLELQVSPAVLIPRPETEVLVEQVLKDLQNIPKPRVLDIGTGSGAIALGIKHERPDAVVMASDISKAALEVAKLNAQTYNLDLTFVCSDLLASETLKRFCQQVDVLVANLPYLPEADKTWLSAEVKHDPELALFAGEDGLEVFRHLVLEAYTLIQPGALLWLELDPRNIEAALTYAQHWSKQAMFLDLVGRKRFLRLQR